MLLPQERRTHIHYSSEESIMPKHEETNQASVTRTLRAAVKVGDDYYMRPEAM